MKVLVLNAGIISESELSANSNYQLLEFSGSNNFSLLQTPTEPQKVQLFINGNKAAFGTDFVIDGSTLIWLGTFNLENSDIIEAYY
ncbi:hypothetical protein [Nostoc sp. FACHB-110]|uniref:hypothetical protein n=1 Tax=Nostoc sp. FACHB-110 TaxID=2692834 RepID=UPI0016852E06|nr:hypothetical protein [Nostoc sp. FACHB-110]MBD2437364.1 hypothetical protein [Nostoc sp. FACHB-110]